MTDRVPTVWSGELEWTDPVIPQEPVVSSAGLPFDQARLLVRLRGTPVGFVQVALERGMFDSAAAIETVRSALGGRLAPGEEGPPHPPQSDPPLHADAPPLIVGDAQPLVDSPAGGVRVTVCVCTRNRPEGVRRCIEAIERTTHADIELLIVDNAPADDATAAVAEKARAADPRVRYVREPHPGLSCARNRGVAEATGEIIAFTDDDVRVDALWVEGVLSGFAQRGDVGCVTGLVASTSLERAAEQFFDARVSWSSSCERQVYDLRSGGAHGPLYPYAAGMFGTGANMAFRVDILRAIGGFDECLGAGSPTSGGEDLDIFVRTLRAGSAICYEPAALVWHDHRVDAEELERQMFGYGKGLAAYLAKLMLSRTAPQLARRMVAGAWHYVRLVGRSKSAESGELSVLAADLRRAEWRGLLAGGPAYLRARRRQSPERRRAVAP